MTKNGKRSMSVTELAKPPPYTTEEMHLDSDHPQALAPSSNKLDHLKTTSDEDFADPSNISQMSPRTGSIPNFSRKSPVDFLPMSTKSDFENCDNDVEGTSNTGLPNPMSSRTVIDSIVYASRMSLADIIEVLPIGEKSDCEIFDKDLEGTSNRDTIMSTGTDSILNVSRRSLADVLDLDVIPESKKLDFENLNEDLVGTSNTDPI